MAEKDIHTEGVAEEARLEAEDAEQETAHIKAEKEQAEKARRFDPISASGIGTVTLTLIRDSADDDLRGNLSVIVLDQDGNPLSNHRRGDLLIFDTDEGRKLLEKYGGALVDYVRKMSQSLVGKA